MLLSRLPLLLCVHLAAPLALDPAVCSARGSCAADISAAISACRGGAACTVVLPPGIYALAPPPSATSLFTTPAQDNLLVSAYGAVFNLSAPVGVWVLSPAANVTIEGLTLDMARAPFTLGAVLASTASESTLAVDEGVYPLDAGAQRAWPFIGAASRAVGYNTTTMGPSVGGVDIRTKSAPWPLERTGAGRARLRGLGTALPVGSQVLLTHAFSAPVFSARSVRGLTLRDITVHAGTGIGVLANGCTGITLEGVRLARSRGRHGTVTAGSTHFANSRGGALVLRNCSFQSAGDDGANPNNSYQEVESIAGDRLSAIVGMHGVAAAQPLLLPGDAITFFSRRTFAALGGSVVASVDNSTGGVAFASRIPPAVGRWDLAQAARGNSPDSFLVEDCVFEGNRARGGLFKASNTLIRRSRFAFTAMAAVQSDPDAGCRWFEGSGVRNWTLEDSTIDHVNAQLGAVPGSADVWLTNCVPSWAGGEPAETGAPFWLNLTQNEGVTIARNTFLQGAGGQPAVSILAAEGVAIVNNTVAWDGGGAPRANFVGFGVARARVEGNVCGGGPCVAEGLG